MSNGNRPLVPVATLDHRAGDLGIPTDPCYSDNVLVAPTDPVRSLLATGPHTLAAGRPPHLTTSGAAPAHVPVTLLPAIIPPRSARIAVETTMLPAGPVRRSLAPGAMAFTKVGPENPVSATLFTAAAGSLVPSVSRIVLVPIDRNVTAAGARHLRISSSWRRHDKTGREQGKR
jgi:hypothetical protein